MTEEQEQVYDLIEEQIRRGVKRADSKCRKVRRGKVPFSEMAQKIMRKLRIIKLVKKRKQMKGHRERPKNEET